jgi:hypothetical protein
MELIYYPTPSRERHAADDGNTAVAAIGVVHTERSRSLCRGTRAVTVKFPVAIAVAVAFAAAAVVSCLTAGCCVDASASDPLDSASARLLSAGTSPLVCLSFAGWLSHCLLSRASASHHLLLRSRRTHPFLTPPLYLGQLVVASYLFAPPPPLDAQPAHNWLCHHRRRCKGVVAVDAQASLPSSRLRLSPLSHVVKLASLPSLSLSSTSVAIVVARAVAVVIVASRAVAIIANFVARRAIAIAIVIVVVAHRAVPIVVVVVAHCTVAIIVDFVAHCAVTIIVDFVARLAVTIAIDLSRLQKFFSSEFEMAVDKIKGKQTQ